MTSPTIMQSATLPAVARYAVLSVYTDGTVTAVNHSNLVIAESDMKRFLSRKDARRAELWIDGVFAWGR